MIYSLQAYPDATTLETFLAWAGNTTAAANANTRTYPVSSANNAAAGNTTYGWSGLPGGTAPTAGSSVTISGFTIGANNGTFVVQAGSTNVSLILNNAGGVAETHAATAVFALGIFYPAGIYQGISYALGLFGWIQTADTGQVNWATITTVPSPGSTVYEVWRMNDTLHTSFPVHMKIEYGPNGGSSTPSPQVLMTIGTNGTDGAGNILLPHTPQTRSGAYIGAGQLGHKLNCWLSGDSGSFRMLMFSGNDSETWFFSVISRLNDAGGNPVGTGVVIWATDLNSSSLRSRTNLVWNASIGGTGIAEGLYFIGALPADNQTTNLNGNILVSPAFVNVGGLSNPSKDLFFGKANDFQVDEAIQQFPVYGVSHQFIVSHNQLNPNFLNALSCVALIRYE